MATFLVVVGANERSRLQYAVDRSAQTGQLSARATERDDGGFDTKYYKTIDGTGATDGPMRTLYLHQKAFGNDDSAVLLATAQTGILHGCVISAGPTNGRFSVSAGQFIVLDETSHRFVIATLDAASDVVDSFPAALLTYISVEVDVAAGRDSSLPDAPWKGKVVQRTTPYLWTESGSRVRLGSIGKIGGVAAVNASNEQWLARSSGAPRELLDAVGPLNLSGNVFRPAQAGGAMEMLRTAGSAFRASANYVNSLIAPNTRASSAIDPVEFSYIYQDGVGGTTTTAQRTEIDPTKYDDGSGTLQNVSNNDWTIQQIYLSPTTDFVAVGYGQEVWNNFTDAEDAYARHYTEVEQRIKDNLMRRGSVIVRGNATDLSDPSDAVFVSHGRFGGVPG